MNNDLYLHPHSDQQTPNSHMLDAALDYIRRGWPVMPLQWIVDGQCSCGNTACTNQGKHPRTVHGVKDATTDEATIRQWWTQWSDANIGIHTGAISGIAALDVDPRHGGQESLQQLIQAHPTDFPKTVRSLTGGGGSHLLFQYPGQPITNKVNLLQGI